MIIFLDLHPEDASGLISQLRATPGTAHLPIIAFGTASEELLHAGREKGTTLVVSEAALLTHLPGLLEQALRIE